MSRPTNSNDSPLSLDMIDEDRVRRALGLKTSGGTPHQQRPEQARQRHRFVTDGSVPVVMLNRSDSETSGLKDRLAAAEQALEHERTTHAATRRALQEATQANQALRTHAGHTELSHNEALRTEREARRETEAALAALRTELDERRSAEIVAQPVKQRREIKASQPIIQQPRTSKEPKPVRWWTPSYRAKQR